MYIELFPLLALGFGLGFVHALDADHVMAVSALNNQKPGIFRTFAFSAHWALGHATVLLVVGVLLFVFNFTLSQWLQSAAELSVGILLIGLGLVCFWQFRRENIQMVKHRHGDIVHTHWHKPGHEEQNNSGQHSAIHKPVMVGMLHGLAGSAPVLALIPAVGEGQISLAVFYLLMFSLGVALSMMAFGLGYAYLQHLLQRYYQAWFQWSRRAVAALSVLIGSYWLLQAL